MYLCGSDQLLNRSSEICSKNYEQNYKLACNTFPPKYVKKLRKEEKEGLLVEINNKRDAFGARQISSTKKYDDPWAQFKKISSSIFIKPKSQGAELWKILECLSGVNIPHHVKKILTICGYDNALSLSCIDEKRLLEIEVIVKTMYGTLVQSNAKHEEKVECFHVYAKAPDKYRLVPGFRDLILQFVKIIKINRKDFTLPKQ